MRKSYCLLVACVLLLSCCGHSNKPQDLPAFLAVVDLSKDIILHTSEGALIHIPAQTYPHRIDPHVRLTIHHSRNVIGIELAKGQDKTPVNGYVALPAASFDKDMFLYTGTSGANGDFIWTIAHPLYYTPPSKDIVHGKQLFSDNCASCHTLKYAEPDLFANVTQRHDRQWLQEFTRDNEKLRASGDKYANDIYNAFNKAPMPPFPQLSDRDIDDIYHYVDYTHYQGHRPFPDSLLQQHSDGYYQFPFDSLGWYKLGIR